ncbi:MAG: helix-turn-helix domain-containing protein [Anaerolineae bacterium]|nr:helix-turn-helix domain-containing protein [Anaerolineae bacterium]
MNDIEIILRQFGKNVRYWRKIRGFSQEELAERCGLHRTYIGGIERGERNVALINIVKLSTALEVSVSNLIERADAG